MYAVTINIGATNSGIITAAKAQIPPKGGQGVNDYDYYIYDGESEGVYYLIARIRFDEESDQDTLLNNLVESRGGLVGIINACEEGSKIEGHICNGDSDSCVRQPLKEYKK